MNTNLQINKVVNMVSHFQGRWDPKNWKVSFEAVKKRVHNTMSHVFVQESSVRQMIHFTYMHPQVTKNMSQDSIRDSLNTNSLSSIVIHAPTCEIMSVFGPKSYTYASNEIMNLNNDIQYFSEDSGQVFINTQQNSITFTAKWFNNDWLLSTNTITVANDATFGSTTSLYSEFVRLFSQDQIDALDTSVIQIFNITSNVFSPMYTVEEIIHLNKPIQPVQEECETLPVSEFQPIEHVQEESKDFELSEQVQEESKDPKLSEDIQEESKQSKPLNEFQSKEQLQQIINDVIASMSSEQLLKTYEQNMRLITKTSITIVCSNATYTYELDSYISTLMQNCTRNYINTKQRMSFCEYLRSISNTDQFAHQLISKQFVVVDNE